MPNDPRTEPVVHLMRESVVRPGAMRLVCGANQREADAWCRNDVAEVNCPACLAVIARERAAA